MVSEMSGTISNASTFELQWSQKKKRKRKHIKKIWRDYSWKFLQHGKGNGQPSPRGTKSTIHDKPKGKYTKTHTNQTKIDKIQRKNIKSSKGKVTSNIHLKLIFQQKLCRPEGNCRIYLKYWKGKSTTKITVPGKDLIQNWWRNKKLFRQVKVKRIHCHQTSFTTNVKGTYIVKKYKRRKKIYKNNPKQWRKWKQECIYQ